MLVWFQTRAGMRRRLTFLGFTIYLAQSWSQKSSKIVFQTEGKRFSRAKATMREQLHRMKHHPVKEQARAINQILNQILRGHVNYYGIAGNAPPVLMPQAGR